MAHTHTTPHPFDMGITQVEPTPSSSLSLSAGDTVAAHFACGCVAYCSQPDPEFGLDADDWLEGFGSCSQAHDEIWDHRIDEHGMLKSA